MVQKIFRSFKGKEIRLSEERFIPSRNNGPDIRIRIFRPKTKEALPAMLYIHGGGYLVGLPELSLYTIKYIETRPCIVIAPDYRKTKNTAILMVLTIVTTPYFDERELHVFRYA